MAAMASSSCLPSACRPAPARPARAAAGAVMASAAPPPTGRGATPSTSREVSASAAAFAPTFAPTCPWPRTTEYGSYEPAARGGVGWKAWLNKLLDGDTAALPPAVAPLAGHFTDGGVTCALSGGGSAPPTSGGLVGWAASVWRYRGLS